MRTSGRTATYVSLWIYAVAFGFIEASVVVYLRELYLRDPVTGSGVGLQVTQVALPLWTVRIELVRETCTMLVLAAVGWMCSSRMAGRWGGFLIGFGIWDLMYYVTLWLIIDWPQSLFTWDILFLIPIPWVAPVWAPVVVASLFVAIGSWLFFTDVRPRAWRWRDAALLLAGCAVIVGSFLVESDAAAEHRVPTSYPAWLYWAGVATSLAAVAAAEARRPAGRRV